MTFVHITTGTSRYGFPCFLTTHRINDRGPEITLEAATYQLAMQDALRAQDVLPSVFNRVDPNAAHLTWFV